MKKKIIVTAFSNLTTDQRIEKVCKTLHDNGYVIELIGCNYGCNQEVKREYTVEKINLISKSLKTAYFEFNWKLYQKLLNKSFENTVLLTNDLDTLLPNFLLSKKKKFLWYLIVMKSLLKCLLYKEKFRRKYGDLQKIKCFLTLNL